MRKAWRKVICALLATSLFSLTGCSLIGEGGGLANDGEDTPSGKDPLIPVLPTIPDAPEEEVVVLPEKLDFTPGAVVEQYGYRNFASMKEKGEMYCYFYLDLHRACVALTADKTITPTKHLAQNGDGETEEIDLYIVKTLDFGKYDITVDEALAIWKTFRMDYPEFYWIDNQVSYGGKTLNLQIVPDYALGSVRTQLQTRIEAKANQCFSYLSADMTSTEMALTIYDYVITSLYYAYKTDENGQKLVDEYGKEIPEDAVWAHNIIGLAENGKGVCETYAKSFEYLCSLIGIEAITVGGLAGRTKEEVGGHAWNVVKLDGVWYCVDSTWGDQSTLYRDWFGTSAVEFEKTHTPDMETLGFGKEWQYKLPTLSEKALAPVRMQEGKDKGKMYGCIDYAFAEITDEQGEYTITLLPDTTVTTAKGTKLHHYTYSFATGALPKAKKITFVGERNGIVPISMRTESAVTLWSDIYLMDIAWTYPSLVKNGYDVEKSVFSSYDEER
ncbi:MAG: hypothetical protein E7368_00250 [Clostridiales bacterium]|nr:hypothetical protein [Clostridiales bacterium]